MKYFFLLVTFLPVIALGLIVGVTFETGIIGVIVFLAIAGLWALASNMLPCAIALKTGNPAAVNSSFLLFLPVTFLTTVFVPEEALTGWMAQIVKFNPVTYLLQGQRSLISDGWVLGDLLAALAGIGGDFYKGVEIAGQLLAIRGKVIPSTTTNVTLVGSTVSGQRLVGESRVGAAGEHLRMVALYPPDAPAHPDAMRAIEEADLIILGPGSLFTSIVPNLLVKDIAAAVANANGLKMYVCNVAGEAGETAGLSLLDHLNVIRYYAGTYSVDIVIANDNLLGGNVPETVSLIDPKQAWQDPAVRVLADIIDEAKPTRHEPAKLAAAITQTYRQHRGKRRRLPLLWHNVQQPAHFNGGEPVGANQQSS